MHPSHVREKISLDTHPKTAYKGTSLRQSSHPHTYVGSGSLGLWVSSTSLATIGETINHDAITTNMQQTINAT